MKSISASCTSLATSTRTGPETPGSGDVESRLDDVREFLDVLNEPRVLDDRERDAGRVRLLERVGADQAVRTWPVMQTSGVESIHASAIGVTRLVTPGPDVAMATPTRPEARA